MALQNIAGACRLRVVLINIAPQGGKRKHFGKLPFQRTFNFGLLSIASYIAKRGFEVEVWDTSDARYGQIDALTAALSRLAPDVVGLSCISGFSYPNLIEICTWVRDALPTCKIIVGGMDHVGRIPDAVLDEAPEVDAVVCGYGERALLNLLLCGFNEEISSRIEGVVLRNSPSHKSQAETGLVAHGNGQDQEGNASFTSRDPQTSADLTPLDYHLYSDFQSYPASLEMARGCPFTCSFCVSAGGTLTRRTPVDLAEQMLGAAQAYDDPNVRLYLEAPLAAFSREYLRALKRELRSRGISPSWRMECRVDSLHPDLADELAEAGCRVIDLGLESASPEILTLMEKTRSVDRYLARCSLLLKSLMSAGIFNKINVLFYAGENELTLRQTHDYLDDHRSFIGSIAAGPLYLYPGIGGRAKILEALTFHGGGIVSEAEWSDRHLEPVNPSRTVSFQQLTELSLQWEREFQSAYDYWYNRQWGYFSPGTTYEMFVRAIFATNIDAFPFRAESIGLMSGRFSES